jgi:uncharacterized membrane protein YbhN (UPF0104 family)
MRSALWWEVFAMLDLLNPPISRPRPRSSEPRPDAFHDQPARRRPTRRQLTRALTVAVLILLAVEIILAWPSLTDALAQLRTPHPGWLAGGIAAGLAVLAAYGRMQRRLLLSAGVKVPVRRHISLAYAAHALSATLPAGPAFSTRFNYQQMRRFGAAPAVASWAIALSGIFSGAALAVITAVSALTAHGTPPWWTLAGLAAAATAATFGVRELARRPSAVTGALTWANRLLHRPAGTGLDRVRDFTDQLRAARLAPRHGVAAAVFALLNWLFDAACLWMCVHAVGGTAIPPAAILLAYCAAMSVGTLTIVPGGLGVIDTALILGLTHGGAGTSAAIAIVVLYRLISFGLVVAIGWILWALGRRRSPEAGAHPAGPVRRG